MSHGKYAHVGNFFCLPLVRSRICFLLSDLFPKCITVKKDFVIKFECKPLRHFCITVQLAGADFCVFFVFEGLNRGYQYLLGFPIKP